MLNKISIIIVITIISFLSVQAQHIQAIINDENQSPVDLATVEFLSVSDSVILSTTSTDKSGSFKQLLHPGEFIIRISYLGYKEWHSSPIKLQKSDVDLGIILLEPQGEKLNEIIVTRQRKLIEQRADRMVINVENSILSDGLNALEILQRSPGVRIDDDGNLSMRGKAGIGILINGKLTYLSTKELALLLKGTPSSSIKSVELITNPSAKFDAAGNGGLINIVMKTETRTGINGTAHTFAGMGRKERYGGGATLNIKQNKLNILGGYDYGYRGEEEYRNFDRDFGKASPNDRLKYSKQYSLTDEPLNTHNSKLVIDYDITEKMSIGTSWTGNFGTYRNTNKGYNNIYFEGDELISNSLTNNNGLSKWSTHNLNINLLNKLGKKDHELAIDVDYMRADYKADQTLTSDFQQTIHQDPFLSVRQAITPSLTDLYITKIDYLHHINSHQKFETGWKSSWITADNNAIHDTLINEGWIRDQSTTNHFIYNEQIHAGYLNYNLEQERWNLTLGLRLEHTRMSGHQLTSDQRNDKRYTQLFPSLSLGYKPNGRDHIQFSYSRRIQRPDYEMLNPFRFYIDAFVFWEGNPHLQPELAHSFEANYILGDQLTIALFHTQVKDVMTSVLTQLPDQNVTIRSAHNIDGFQNSGVNVNFSFRPAPFWSSINNISGYHNNYFGSFNGEDIKNKQWAGTFLSMNTFNLGKKWNAELNGEYNTTQVDGVLTRDPYGSVSAGVMKKLFDDKLVLKLAATDIFRTLDYNTSSKVGGVSMRQTIALDSRTVMLSLSYKIGGGIESRKKKSGNEEQNRVRGGG